MKVKVCGLKQIQNIIEVSEAGADLVGLIFYKESPRFVNDSLNFDEARLIRTMKAGVFVNEKVYSVLNTVAHYDLDFVQLHGKETPEMCTKLKPFTKIIKSFGVDLNFDFSSLKCYENCVDYFLFDTSTSVYGGSGNRFDWNLLKNYELDKPFFLSGGISLEDAVAIKKLNIKQLFGVDINSRFEISPGIKEVNKIRQFINEVK